MTTERDLGARVVAHLTAQGWSCSCEVEPLPGPRADIVAVRDGVVWLVECKTRLNFGVIAQAESWAGWAHRRSVATALGPRGDARKAALRALTSAGLGWIESQSFVARQVHLGELVEVLPAAHDPSPRRVGILLDALRPAHAESAPGTAGGGGHWTGTDEGRHALAQIVAATPGIPLRRALCEGACSMRVRGTPAEVRQWAGAIRMGLVPRVRGEGRGTAMTLWTDEETL